MSAPATSTGILDRRQILHAVAWGAPVIALVSAAPALAASQGPSMTASASPTLPKVVILSFVAYGGTEIRVDSVTPISGPAPNGLFNGPFSQYVSLTGGTGTQLESKNNADWTGTTWRVTYYVMVNGVWEGPYYATFVR